MSSSDCIRIEELGPRKHARVIAEALDEWRSRRDPGQCYHVLSKLSPSYLGWPVRTRRESEYYKEYPGAEEYPLPPPARVSGVDVLEAIRSRESRRRYSGDPLTLLEVATILYHTVGVTGEEWWGGPKRVYPSAGALQPVEAYLAAGRVEGLPAGVYHYNPGRHVLELLSLGDPRDLLYKASLRQDHVRDASASVILTVVYSRTASKYDVRSYRYVMLDAGFAGENLYLAVEALGLATVAVGAFYDDMVCGLLGIDCRWEHPALIFPVGRRPRRY